MSGKELPVTDTLSKLHCIFDNWCVVEYRKYFWIQFEYVRLRAGNYHDWEETISCLYLLGYLQGRVCFSLGYSNTSNVAVRNMIIFQ